MPYIIPSLLLFLGLVRPKDKWLTILFLLYFWALIGLNTFTPDYESYETKYETFVLLDQYEIGHQALVLLCNFLGFTYQEFRMVYAFLTVFFLYIALRRSSIYQNYILALLLLWPFVGGVSGIRQNLANMIVCCGIPCLFQDGTKPIIKYLFWIFLAWTIHQSSLFFLVLSFSRLRFGYKEKRLIVLLVVIGVFVVTSTQLLGNIPFIANNVVLNKWMNLAGDDSADHQNLAGFVIRAFFVCCYAFFVPFLAKTIKQYSILEKWEIKRLDVISNASLLLILTIPGYVISGEYQRFLYALLFLYYVVFAEFRFKHFEKRFPQRSQMIVVCFCLILLTAGYYMFSMTSHDVLATFKDNLVFK